MSKIDIQKIENCQYPNNTIVITLTDILVARGKSAGWFGMHSKCSTLIGLLLNS